MLGVCKLVFVEQNSLVNFSKKRICIFLGSVQRFRPDLACGEISSCDVSKKSHKGFSSSSKCASVGTSELIRATWQI